MDKDLECVLMNAITYGEPLVVSAARRVVRRLTDEERARVSPAVPLPPRWSLPLSEDPPVLWVATCCTDPAAIPDGADWVEVGEAGVARLFEQVRNLLDNRLTMQIADPTALVLAVDADADLGKLGIDLEEHGARVGISVLRAEELL